MQKVIKDKLITEANNRKNKGKIGTNTAEKIGQSRKQ